MLPHEMYVNYLIRRKSDLAELEKALASSNFEPFKRLGHQMKGNASSFGFNDLAQLAEKLEVVSVKGGNHEAEKLLGDFKTWIIKKEAELIP
jgi:HPt (histidine-containing phosphotransfer) domain-containing protein